MIRKVIHIIGTGTIGEPLIGLLADMKESLGIDKVTFHKRTPLLYERAKVKSLIKRGAYLATDKKMMKGFSSIGVEPTYETDEAIENASVVIDCTPPDVGPKDKLRYFKKFTDGKKGFIIQGGKFKFGKLYARDVNDSSLDIEKDRFIQIVSCNTHNIAVIINTLALKDEEPDNLIEGRFVCIRRASDISQDIDFIPAPKVKHHYEPDFGTHHARDAACIFKTMGLDLNLFSSSIRVNSQYMHVVWFDLKVKRATNLKEIYEKLDKNPLLALTEKTISSLIFSFGRDHGHYGRILNQAVVSLPTLHVKNGHEIFGYSFTPQDGNSILSSIAAAEWFIYPKTYIEKIQCLSHLFFKEI